jgi:6-pyruvoyltetrahydropterin/6-carboxytetrahydropterin synthase
MYTVAIQRIFNAQHHLIGGDWGAENEEHSHEYRVEVRLEKADLDQHGYVVDIVELEESLDRVVARYRDRSLNDLPEFEGLNPSIENFARIIFHAISELSRELNAHSLEIRIWENDIAWTSYREEA